jgi:hypothetical protein
MKKVRIVIENGGPLPTKHKGFEVGRLAQLTRVFIDGEERKNIQSVKFNATMGDAVLVTVSFFPDEVEVESVDEPQVNRGSFQYDRIDRPDRPGAELRRRP